MDNIEDGGNFNIIDIKKIIPKMKSIIPNALLIFSIGVVIILILLSVKYTEIKTIGLMTSFYFALNPCNSYEEFIAKTKKTKSCGDTVQKESVIVTDDKETIEDVISSFKEDYCEKRDLEDLDGVQPLLYVCRAAYLVTSNMSNIIIKGLYKLLNLEGRYSVGVLMLYIGIFVVLKLFREFIDNFIPKGKSKKSSFIFDIIFSIFSITTVVFILCLIPSIISYLMFLVYGFVLSNGAGTNVLRTMFFICIAIIPIMLWIVGADINITEGLTNKQKKKKEKKKEEAAAAAAAASAASGTSGTSSASGTSGTSSSSTSGTSSASSKKCNDFNWIYYIGFALIIPIVAALKQIPFLIINGINGLTCISTDAEESKKNILFKLSFIYAYGIIIFIGMFLIPIIIHMLRNITKEIKFTFLTEFLDKIEDLTQIVK